MAGLPINFAVPGEGAVASYEWTDIASGTGMTGFDGATTTNSTTTAYHLSDKIVYSASGSSAGASGFDGTTTMTFYLSAYNKPITLKGTAYFYFGMATYGADQSDGTKSVYAIMKLYKLSGGVSTQIGTTQTSATQTSGRNQFIVSNYLMKTDIAQTNFKIGDQLYLQVEFVQTGSSNSYGWFFHDPVNNAFKSFIDGSVIDATFQTIFKVYIPSKIEL